MMFGYVDMLIAELRYGAVDNMLSEARANMYMYPEELRYNHNHDPSNGRFTSGFSGGYAVDVNVSASDNGGNGKIYQNMELTNGGGSGMMNTGAVSGALNPYSKEAEKHAVQYYESVRHMKTDTQKISAATGISRDKIGKIKNHVFITEHDLLTGHKR